ncbi:adenylate/guanylate cyclase domain-containing protein [bacterium]|nr:adenylate/guanylate cyclase domain-containing protein [bacterium]
MKLTYTSKRYWLYFIAFVVSIFLSIISGKFQLTREFEQYFRKPFYNVLFETDRSFDVVIIKIDEKTFNDLKTIEKLAKYKDAIWPLPPCIYGELLDRISEYGAVSVGFDIIFESFENVFLPWYAEYDSFIKAQKENDIPVILGAKRSGNKLIKPCKQLQKKGFEIGLINVKRRFGEIISYRFIQEKYNSLAYALAKTCGRKKGIDIAGWSNDLLKEKHLITFQNSPGRGFPMISFSDVLLGKVPEHLLKYWKIKNIYDLFDGKDILVAVTLIEHYDYHSSPADSKDGQKLHGVEFHANAMDMLLNYSKLRYKILDSDITFIILIISAIISWILLLNLRPFHWLWVSIFIMFTYYLGIIKIFQETRVFFPLISIYICYFLFGTISTFLVWSLERKEKKFIQGAFGKYVPETVAKQISDNPDALKLGGRKMDISVLFCDICGFTGISEKMSSEELITFLNTYLDAMTDEIFKTEGTLDKYIGDAIMAFWGAPFKCQDHAIKACNAALHMTERLVEFNKLEKETPDISMGIGIHSGESVVGNAGSQRRFDYTAIGDNVNTSSRLEGLTRLYKVSIIISGDTRNQLQNQFDIRFLDRVTVKGKKHVTDLYELVSLAGESDQKRLEINDKAMDSYFKKDWDNAERLFKTLNEKYHDTHSKILLERIRTIKSDSILCKEHNGVFELKSK